MTERSGSLPVVTAAGAVFCVVLAFLALQMRDGNDPAIGAGEQAAEPSRPVVIRRVIVRRIVEDPAAPAGAARSAPASGPAPASAPAPDLAPAPAPDPVVTQAS
jgi:hypothetical protein